MPAAKPSPAVYRRRRLVALLLLLAVIGLVWWGIAALAGALSGGDPAPTGTPDAAASTASPEPGPESAPGPTPESTPEPTPEPTPTPTPTPAPGPPPACTPADVVVTARTDAGSYAADAQPQFSFALQNRSEHDCVIDVGTAAQVFTVTSGSDTIWVSTHCQADPAHQEVLLEAGRTVESPPLGWVRERSRPDTCEGERPAAVGGGAYYHLTVTVAGIGSEASAFVLE